MKQMRNDKQRILSTVCFFHAFDDGALSVIPLLFPIFKIMFDLSYTQIGIVTSGGLMVSLISQFLIGRISDTKNYRTLLLTGILLLSFSMLFFTQIQGFFTIMICMFFLRFSSSFFHPIGIGLISRTFKKENLDSAMGIQSACGDFGAFIAVLTTLYIAEWNGWQFPFYIWSFFGIIIFFMGILITRNMDETFLPYHKISRHKQKITEAFNEWMLMMKKMKLFIPLFIISGAVWGVTISYLPLYLDEKTSLLLPIIGIIVSCWIGIGALVSFFYGKIQRKVGRKNILILSYFFIGFSSILLLQISATPFILCMIFLLGIFSFLSYPTLFSFISEATHESIEGKTFGYTFTLQLGGGTIFLFISGALADFLGIWIPFAILGVSSLLAAVMLFIYRKQTLISLDLFQEENKF